MSPSDTGMLSRAWKQSIWKPQASGLRPPYLTACGTTCGRTKFYGSHHFHHSIYCWGGHDWMCHPTTQNRRRKSILVCCHWLCRAAQLGTPQRCSQRIQSREYILESKDGHHIPPVYQGKQLQRCCHEWVGWTWDVMDLVWRAARYPPLGGRKIPILLLSR